MTPYIFKPTMTHEIPIVLRIFDLLFCNHSEKSIRFGKLELLKNNDKEKILKEARGKKLH